jgi:hypothetical protein
MSLGPEFFLVCSVHSLNFLNQKFEFYTKK